MKKLTSKKLIQMLEKKDIKISEEQATEIVKLPRLLTDTAVENYLRENAILSQNKHT